MTAAPSPSSDPADAGATVSATATSVYRETLRQATAIDRAVYAAVAGTDTPALDRAVARLSKAADYSVLWLSMAALLAAIGGRRGRAAARDGMVAIGLASAVSNQVLKRFAARPRPDRAVAAVPESRRVHMPASTSFPSGHSASAFAFATSASARVPALSPLLHSLAGLVAYSRVHTGVHYPGDVVAGSLVGAAIGHGATWILRRRRPR